jgi:dipeptidyl aminopeptidase/acylaminoacyl peptidase
MQLAFSRALRLACYLCFCVAAASAHAAGEVSIDTLFKLPQYSQMRLSPDGKSLAALAPVGDNQSLMIIDLETKKPSAVSSMAGTDIVWYQWLGNDRFILESGMRGKRVDDLQSGTGQLWAIDRDGSNARRLNETNENAVAAAHGLRLVRTLPGDTTDVIAQEMTFDSRGSHPGALVRVDTRSGRRMAIAIGAPSGGESEHWVVDRKGVARALSAIDKGTARIFYRAGEDAAWKKLDEFPALSPGWEPLGVGDDDKTLIVAAHNGQDKTAIMRYDPATRTFGETMARHPKIDLDSLIWDEGRPVGVRYEADRGGTAMFDELLARVQDTVDRAFPDAVNVLSWSRDRSKFVVFSYSDRSPGAFFLFDLKSGRMQWLADVAPWIKAEAMAPMKPVRYKARDGLEIPAYLTLPPGSDGRNLPLVMVIHGGPWVRGDRWGFDPEVQFLASRGYAVLQPNFRGTLHYGWKHYSASFGQWGLAMEEDIEDGVHWAVEQGIADAKRVAIYGASYGGYAVMMGLAKTPDLYRCGIDYVGVTDLPLFLTATWADYSRSDFVEHGLYKTVGDPDKDAKRLRETSPVHLADRIKVPVLMAYGAADRRVPIEHGTRMKSALDRAGAQVEWMVVEGEGHGFRALENQKAFYGAMERFLARNLK